MKLKINPVRPLILASALLTLFLYACDKDDDIDTPQMRSTEYALNAVAGSGADGKIIISENADSSFNVNVTINNSVKDTVHILHIHNGSISNPGGIAVPLTSITGTGGTAQSQTLTIKQVVLPDSSTQNITYNGILNFTGYINVHYSAAKSDSLISQGNIGSN